jgi:hypothetical protein
MFEMAAATIRGLRDGDAHGKATVAALLGVTLATPCVLTLPGAEAVVLACVMSRADGRVDVRSGRAGPPGGDVVGGLTLNMTGVVGTSL